MKRCPMIAILLAVAAVPVRADDRRTDGKDEPWWRRTKIVFMWGQWNKARVDRRVDDWIGELPREHLRRLARAGGTVFCEAVGMVKGHPRRPAHAHAAHAFGLEYFATRYVGLPRYRPAPDDSGRKWVAETGAEPGGPYNCTLEQRRYAWLEKRDLVHAYKQRFHARCFAMFVALCEKLLAINPDLLLASYDVLRPSHPEGRGSTWSRRGR